MGILTESGRAAIAASIKVQPIHLAWGIGDEAWDNTPPVEDAPATGLLNEVGRRVLDEALFCVPDLQGELVTPTGRFTASNEPTNNLYLRFTFDFDDAPDKTIRELGVMVGTVLKEGLPEGQRYFELQDIEDKGILLLLENTVPLVRTEATRETFTFVVTF